ncbi:geraniol 8-hydroxylase-like [Triticum aestivum]|nr:geraniol 8-hydroxylase-like [Triticum aestivum]
MADLQWRAMFSSGLDAATTRELHAVAREAALLALKPNVSDFFPALAALDLQGIRRSMTRQLGKVYRLIDQEIDQRRRGREAGSVDGREKDDLLDVMLQMCEVDGAAVMNQDSMRAFLTDLFLAAIDTVSGAIEWAMAELLQNPETMKKLKEELSRVLGSKEHVEYSDNLPYLQAVVKETLRLHAVVPLAPNKVEQTVEIQGYTIPKGSTVIVNLWAIHHNAQVWTEPDKFIPERFLCKEVNFQGMDFEFMPFSAGRRICLGLPLATRMLPALLGSLLHRFEWTLPEEAMKIGVDMSEKLGLTMSMATPLQAIVVKTL